MPLNGTMSNVYLKEELRTNINIQKVHKCKKMYKDSKVVKYGRL